MRHWRLYAALLLVTAGYSQIPFKVEIAPPRLSNFQRLRTIISVKFDGKDFAKRVGGGQLDISLTIINRNGRKFHSNGSISMKDVPPETKSADIYYSQAILV